MKRRLRGGRVKTRAERRRRGIELDRGARSVAHAIEEIDQLGRHPFPRPPRAAAPFAAAPLPPPAVAAVPMGAPAAAPDPAAPDAALDMDDFDMPMDADEYMEDIPPPVGRHYGFPRTLEPAALQHPNAVDTARSNLYILPVEILNFLESNPQVFDARGNIILPEVREILHRWHPYRRPNPNFDPHPRIERNSEAFLANEFKKMHAGVAYTQRLKSAINPWIFPFVIGPDGETLVIPGRDVLDLPLFVMMFILKRLTQMSYQSGTLLYNFDYDRVNSAEYTINHEDDGRPITIVNKTISPADLQRIYMTIMRKYASLLPDRNMDGAPISKWNGSEESGTRIMLYNMRGNTPLKLRLMFYPVQSVSRAHGWTQQVEDLLQESVGASVISVRNRDDNKCLLYCLVMGLIFIKRGNTRVFGLGQMMVEPTEVYCKGMYLYPDEDDPQTRLMHRLTKLLMPPSYSEGELDPIVEFVRDLDKKAGTMLSVTEFRKEFAIIEEKLITNKECGIDVYGIDYNVNSHVYPLYISKQREPLIELLCVTPLDARCSHYCLIVNMERLMKKSGGKQFFSCSKCGECFYHRRLLKEHKCIENVDPTAVPGDGGYHFSKKDDDARCEIVYGSCPRCRLCFSDEFTYEYHKIHCFMQGQTGYRHVQLVTYSPQEHPTLKGEAIDMEAEEKHVRKRRMMYADFESSIDPETGVHTFMSYGIYEWKSGVYRCGYDLGEFIEFILEVAYDHEEDHVYVYFHNAMGYDANFILRYILKHTEYSDWGIQVIMKSMNRLQKLVLHTHRNGKSRAIHIGDTFLFLTLSLERIVDSIRKEDMLTNESNFLQFFRIFRQRYPYVRDEDIDHILRKNIFPYKFFTDSSKLETSKDEFMSIFEPKEENLKYFGERVSLEDLIQSYEDTKKVIETFRCRNAKDYHDLYLCCDVMQLADVFDRSMKILWESHHIHLTKYLGMPSASWAAFLRHDPTMSIPLYEDTFFAEFFKGMIRGGITSAALRHAVADENHSIIYLDVNGLYPYVMQAYKFPCGTFRFVGLGWGKEQSVVRLKELFKSFEREGKGMCFCVDLHFPDSVKERTDMYPFAPEHRRIFKEYFSDIERKELTPFLKRWSEANNGETMPEFTGLVCTLYDKVKYNVHWRLLKFYMEHGVEVTKVWFGVTFDEGDYLAGYIRKNIEIRNTRRDELGKTLYKLLGNSIYGKTFESPFKRNTYEIIRDKVKLQGMLEEGNIAALTPIDDLGWIVRMDGEDIILDKPTYIGACVCEFSKLHMYTLLYDKLMKIFPECQLVYTDTDSFIVLVRHPEGENIVTPQDLFAYIKRCDADLIGGIGGQVKSETGEDDTIQEVIALRSKVYAYITKNGHIGKRAKGTTHDAQEMQLDWDTYKRALESLTSINTRNVQFVRNTFKIASLDVYRQSLSVNDGKRYICEDGIHTHAFGWKEQ